jgi:hypothetical protein
MCAEYNNVLIQTEESLLVIRGLGIQTSTSSPYFFSSSTTTFIPTTQIQDIVIHEAFKGLEVRFYLAIIVEDATEAVVVFPVRIPHFVILESFHAEFGISVFCRSGRSSKKSGEVLGSVCMMARAKFSQHVAVCVQITSNPLFLRIQRRDLSHQRPHWCAYQVSQLTK